MIKTVHNNAPRLHFGGFKLNQLYVVSALLLFTCMANFAAAQDKPYSVSSALLKADLQNNRLVFFDKASNMQFFSTNLTEGKAVKAVALNILTHPVWGNGKQMVLTEVSGNTMRLSVYDKLPFVMMQRVLVNPGKQELQVSKDQMIRGLVNLNADPKLLRTVSTAGLKQASDPSGGYVYMGVANQATRNGVIAGWLTNEKGSGIVLSEYEDNKVGLHARIDYGDLRIPAGKTYETETLLLGYSKDIRLGLEEYADAMASHLKISLPAMPTVYCTWYHAGSSDEKRIMANADFAHQHMAKYGFNTMQIDDHWQLGNKDNGPRRNFTDVRPNGPFPNGMKPTADYIKSKNFLAGIWYMPFAGTYNDPYWKGKDHMFLKEGQSESNHFYKVKSYEGIKFPKGEAPFEASWGGTCLDLTHPETQEYIRFMAQRLSKEWGYNYFKMDGLWTGTGTRIQYINSAYKDDDLGLQKRHNTAMTPIEAYANGLDIINNAAGEEVFILGCTQTQNMRVFGPSIGRVDAMRVGPDNGANAKSLSRGPQFSSRVYFLNKRVWYNDPDPVYVRQSFPEQMAKTSVSWSAITGSLHSSSFQYADLPPERLDILLRSMPAHTLKTVRPVDFLESDPARVWLLSDETQGPGKYIVGLFNWDIEKPANVSYAVNKMGLPAATQYVAFDYWANKFIPPFTDSISGLLDPGACKIISVKPVKAYPQVVSTSRHLTQGIMDLRNERWNASSMILSGTSDLVAGDAYELRLVTPGQPNEWVVEAVNTTGNGITSSFKSEGNGIRLPLLSATNQTINWEIKFRKNTGTATPAITALNGLIAKPYVEEVNLNWDKASDLYLYKITRNGSYLGEVSTESFIDKDVTPGKTYAYAVQGKAWNGTWSPVKTISVNVPEELILPPTPPKPVVAISGLTPLNVKSNEFEVKGDTIQLGGPLMLTYTIPAGSKRFVASVKMEDEMNKSNQSKVRYSIVGDVGEMGEPPVTLSVSPVISNGKDNQWHFDVELDPRMKQIQLMVEQVLNSRSRHDINWINAGFIK